MIIIPKKNFGINDSYVFGINDSYVTIHFSCELEIHLKKFLPWTTMVSFDRVVPTVMDVYLALESEGLPFYAVAR